LGDRGRDRESLGGTRVLFEARSRVVGGDDLEWWVLLFGLEEGVG